MSLSRVTRVGKNASLDMDGRMDGVYFCYRSGVFPMCAASIRILDFGVE
jgi:hypothetical protein